QFGREQFRLLPSGEVSALGNLVEVGQTRGRSTSTRLRRKIRLLPGNRNGYWHFVCGGLPCRRDEWTLPAVLPIEAARRRRGVRQPVERDVVQHVVLRERLSWVVAVLPLRKACMHQHPCRKADR